MDVWRATAARNNAHWCDALCRSHGIEGRFTDAGWESLDPAPPFYPDVITLRPDASLAELLEPIADRRPCSIKDSFT